MKFYIAIYTHRYGIDVWPVFQDEEPTIEEVAAALDNYEPEREDEYLEIIGPFYPPEPGKDSVCETCGAPADYDPDYILCDKCEGKTPHLKLGPLGPDESQFVMKHDEEGE